MIAIFHHADGYLREYGNLTEIKLDSATSVYVLRRSEEGFRGTYQIPDDPRGLAPDRRASAVALVAAALADLAAADAPALAERAAAAAARARWSPRERIPRCPGRQHGPRPEGKEPEQCRLVAEHPDLCDFTDP